MKRLLFVLLLICALIECEAASAPSSVRGRLRVPPGVPDALGSCSIFVHSNELRQPARVAVAASGVFRFPLPDAPSAAAAAQLCGSDALSGVRLEVLTENGISLFLAHSVFIPPHSVRQPRTGGDAGLTWQSNACAAVSVVQGAHLLHRVPVQGVGVRAGARRAGGGG